MEMNNTSGKYAFVRDAFLESEKEYLEELKKDMSFEYAVEYLQKNFSVHELYKIGIAKMQQIETGEINEDSLEKVERDILICFSAIVDFEQVKEKVLMPDDGLSR